MSVLIVNYEYPPVGAGAATASEAIAKELVKLGHHIVVLTGRFNGLPAFSDSDGITIHRIPSLRRRIDRCSLWEMASFLVAGLTCAPAIMRKHRVEAAIVFFSLPCGPIGLLGRWLRGVPYIISLRGGDVPGTEPTLSLIHRVVGPIRRMVLKNSIAVAANSEALRTMAEASDPFAVRVIPNGVDTEFFAPAQREEIRNEKVLQILFVGRFQEQKNLAFLFEQLVQFPTTTFELHLVGDGPERKGLEGLAVKLGIAAAVTWHGWVSRKSLPALYRSVDCVVNPSIYEGMSNVVLEAMASALPVVASNVPGNADLVIHDETGLLFDLDEPAGLVSALNRLRDADLRSRMGQNARSRARTFSWSTVASKYAALLTGVSTHDGY